ncbi:hypothetical protein ACWDTG_20565 [Rhodococcus zopfii]
MTLGSRLHQNTHAAVPQIDDLRLHIYGIGDVDMATAEQYEKALAKAELMGYSKLDQIEKDLIKRLVNESGSRGNRARKLFDQ